MAILTHGYQEEALGQNCDQWKGKNVANTKTKK